MKNGAASGPAEPARRRVRLLIVDNHQILGEALSAILDAEPDMHVVGTAASTAEATAKLVAFSPDMALIDYHLEHETGVHVADALRALNPDIRTIFMSRSDGDTIRLRALEAGAMGFIHKSKATSEIVAAIRAVARGYSLFTPHEITSLLSLRRHLSAFTDLTNREMEVLRLLRSGQSSRDVATNLGISYATVRVHLRAIESKLGAHNKLDALARARDMGLIG